MKRVVHKHHLDWTPGVQEVLTPVGSKVVHVDMQDDRITVWVEREVGPYADAHPSSIGLRVLATGEEFEFEPFHGDDMIHLGTIQHNWTVWHIYQTK